MIEAKETLIGNISSKKTLTGKINNAIEKVYPELEDIIITPTTEEQHFKSKKYGYNNINVQAVDNTIDSNIQSENIKSGVSILGINGEANILNGEEITINPTSEVQEITPTAPKNGFTKVIVNAQSGVDINDYFETTVTTSNYSTFSTEFLKQFPKVKIAEGVTKPRSTFENFPKVDLVIDVAEKQLKNCEYMFTNSKIKSINLFDTSENTSMYYMFYNCENLKSVPLFNTSNVKSMFYAFYNSGITELLEFDMSNVNDAYGMCYNCRNLLKAGSYNIGTNQSQNVSTSNMFNGCYYLTTIGNLDCSKVTMSYNMFNSCYDLTTIGGLINLGKNYSTTSNANCVLNLSSCSKLTHDSLMNVINSIADVSELGWSPSLILGSTNLAKLTEEEISIATNKNWSVS